MRSLWLQRMLRLVVPDIDNIRIEHRRKANIGFFISNILISIW